MISIDWKKQQPITVKKKYFSIGSSHFYQHQNFFRLQILEGLSPGRHGDLRQNKNQSRKFDDVEGSSVDSQRSAESLADQSSHTTLQGVDVSLKNPPPFSRYRDLYDSSKCHLSRMGILSFLPFTEDGVTSQPRFKV